MTLAIHPVPAFGAEDVAVSPAGDVYTGTEDGSIWRIAGDGSRIDRVADTGGRPLGIELYDPTGAGGELLVCDSERGLLRVDPADGTVRVLATEAGGLPLLVCNNAAIARDGTIWFSDSSRAFPLSRWKHDFLHVTRTGRLLRRDPDGTVTVVLEGLAFANGVALAADESYVAVAESSTRTVVRRWLAGPRAGEQDHLVPDLPGYPDNISRGSDGLIWVAIGTSTDPVIERLQRAPSRIKRLALAMPERLQPGPKPLVRVQAYDDSGRVVHDIDLRDVGFHMVTGVREHEGRLWLGSLHEAAVAVLDLPMK